jgi:hypothetical protein
VGGGVGECLGGLIGGWTWNALLGEDREDVKGPSNCREGPAGTLKWKGKTRTGRVGSSGEVWLRYCSILYAVLRRRHRKDRKLPSKSGETPEWHLQIEED